MKGIRANIYKIASECQAYYNGSAEKSIFYTGNDLNIVLLFADESHAGGFLTRLDLISAGHIRFHNMITFEANIQPLPRPPYPQRVFFKHYQSTDESCPLCLSLADLATVTSQHTAIVLNTGNPDPLIELKSVEKFQLLPPLTRLNKCLLASTAEYKQHIKDDDNIIYGSRNFHNYFDGMMTTTGAPEFALRYGGHEGQFNVIIGQFQNVRTMWKVNVIFEFRDNGVFEWCKHYFREYRSAETNPLTLMIYIYFFDLAKAELFLNIKYEETIKQWNE